MCPELWRMLGIQRLIKQGPHASEDLETSGGSRQQGTSRLHIVQGEKSYDKDTHRVL